MIRIREQDLSPTLTRQLDRLQGAINRLPTFGERVANAKAQFTARNRKDDPLFAAIRAELEAMCAGARRCMYCEDSAADEVEHIFPKRYYPNRVFDWENYLYSCGQCNVAKLSKFALRLADGSLYKLGHARDVLLVPPPQGRPLTLNPRHEDPTAYLMLDIAGETFLLRPRPGIGGEDIERAEYTIDLLKLNRDVLKKGRREAFENCLFRVQLYITKRDSGAQRDELNRIVLSLERMQHPTVWIEMRRQALRVASLAPLVASAPEVFA